MKLSGSISSRDDELKRKNYALYHLYCLEKIKLSVQKPFNRSYFYDLVIGDKIIKLISLL